jgi:hypothetical protein
MIQIALTCTNTTNEHDPERALVVLKSSTVPGSPCRTALRLTTSDERARHYAA